MASIQVRAHAPLLPPKNRACRAALQASERWCAMRLAIAVLSAQLHPSACAPCFHALFNHAGYRAQP